MLFHYNNVYGYIISPKSNCACATAKIGGKIGGAKWSRSKERLKVRASTLANPIGPRWLINTSRAFTNHPSTATTWVSPISPTFEVESFIFVVVAGGGGQLMRLHQRVAELESELADALRQRNEEVCGWWGQTLLYMERGVAIAFPW